MSETFAGAQGRKVISRATAEELGNVRHLLVDAEARRIVSVVLDRRRNARLVNWESLTGFGPDAVIVVDETSLREPQNDRDRAAARGQLELLGRRVLSDLGNELGKIDDVIFNADSGALEAFVIGDAEHPGDSLLGAGSYAVILLVDDAGPSGK